MRLKKNLFLSLLLTIIFVLAAFGYRGCAADHSSVESNTTTPAEMREVTPTPVFADAEMTVHFLDVGQGLSILVQSNGENLVYDGGKGSKSSFVVSYLQQQGVAEIQYLISSHYDEDHVAGLIGCLNVFEVKNVIGADYFQGTQIYQSFIEAVAAEGLEIQHPAVGSEYPFGSGKFTVLAPSEITSNDNDNSVAIKLENGNTSFIFAGDAEVNSESNMCSSGENLNCDVLCLGHHGSATAASYDFLQKTVPEYAVISCGEDNQYGHPHAETMEKLQSMEISMFRTDKQGTILAVSDGTGLTWNVEPSGDFRPGNEEDTPPEPQSAKEQAAQQQPAFQSAPEAEAEQKREDMGEEAWILETGSKCHNKPNCGRMNPDKAVRMSRSDAESLGYEACKNCY